MALVEKKTLILCVEDDQQMRHFLVTQLRARGFQVQAVRDGAQAIDQAIMAVPHLVLLDLSLPSLDGLTFLKRLREWSSAPVIVLSAHDEEPVKIRALDLGADDYLTKPFSLPELLARIRVALRRVEQMEKLRDTAGEISAQRARYRCGGKSGLMVDFAHRKVYSGGVEVHLTPTEYDLLCELARHPGKVLTHKELLMRVWGPDYRGENTYLRTFVRHLRKKLEPDPAQPRYLRNELGVGYFLPANDEEGHHLQEVGPETETQL